MKRRATLSIFLISLALLSVAVPSVSATTTEMTETVYFPTANDTWAIMNYPYVWVEGDYVEGMRDLGLFALIIFMDIHLELATNTLHDEGEVNFDVYINDKYAGNFVVSPGDTAVDVTLLKFCFSWDGVVMIKFLVTETVALGKGSIVIDDMSSTIAFRGLII